jgi:hypothetical protein
MQPLDDLSELVGFFSYSREDDEDSEGALSKLRERIQRELSGQLGRSRGAFRLWQDRAAIPHGALWENEIRAAITQSVFFIPIVTPRAVKSHHCSFEFQSFLARETELGRSDLVFPILYIPVPELEDAKLWHANPVLEIIGKRQYLDWRNLRHLDFGSPEVRLKVEQFCNNISQALRKPWTSPAELEALKKAAADEEEDRKRRGAMAAEAKAKAEAAAAARRKAEEEERRERQVAKAVQPGREQRDEEAARRAEEMMAFNAAERAGSVAAVEAFLASYPASHLGDKARALKARLQASDTAALTTPATPQTAKPQTGMPLSDKAVTLYALSVTAGIVGVVLQIVTITGSSASEGTVISPWAYRVLVSPVFSG